jgi:hypothetical protein
MGKKYNTTSATIAPYAIGLEPMFDHTAYEGIKPSRAAAIVASNRAIALLEADALAERATNWKPKTDKVGRRPKPVATVEMSSQDIDDVAHEEGNWGIVLQDGTVIHECEYRTRMGTVIGTVQGMWGCEKYSHLPAFEFDVVTRRARI